MGDIAVLAKAFLKLGFTAVGSPAVHLHMMEWAFVERRSWLSKALFEF